MCMIFLGLILYFFFLTNLIFLLIFSSKSLLVYNFLYTFAPANQETNHLHG